jgi:hypothetical protein
MRENRERITRVSSDEARRLKGETDYARLDAMNDDDIAKAVANDPDAPLLDVDWDKANIVIPPGKDIIECRSIETSQGWDGLRTFVASDRMSQVDVDRSLRIATSVAIWEAGSPLFRVQASLLCAGPRSTVLRTRDPSLVRN